MEQCDTGMMKKMEECETSINNCMNTKCDAMEANIKQYINATVCAHIDGIFKRLNLLPQNNTDKQNMSKSDDKLVVVPTDNPPKNDGSIVETIDDQPSESAVPEATTGRLEPSTAAKLPSKFQEFFETKINKIRKNFDTVLLNNPHTNVASLKVFEKATASEVRKVIMNSPNFLNRNCLVK